MAHTTQPAPAPEATGHTITIDQSDQTDEMDIPTITALCGDTILDDFDVLNEHQNDCPGCLRELTRLGE
jgi:hypothetical protein